MKFECGAGSRWTSTTEDYSGDFCEFSGCNCGTIVRNMGDTDDRRAAMVRAWEGSCSVKTFTLKIDCDNDAFDPDPAIELAYLLRDIADKIEESGAPSHFKTVLDSNGNDVGRYALKEGVTA